MKRSTAFELALDFRPGRGKRQQTLYDALRDAIVAGRLQPGARLPSTRDLASSYGVARTTVVAVFEQLTLEGYLVARQGAGTSVCKVLPERFLQRAPAKAPSSRPAGTPTLSRRGAALARSPFPLQTHTALRPLSAHLPDLAHFPWSDWARVAAQSCQRLSPLDHASGHPQGYDPLRDAIAGYLTRARGVHCTAAQILVTSGTQQALDLVCRLLLDAGDRVLVEDPGFPGAMQLFAAHGAKPIPVAVDADGMQIPPSTPPHTRARLIHLTPAHQAPTGAALSLPRRHALLAWAGEHGAWVFEDDYDSEYRYLGQPLPALQGLDPHGVVLHAGSFGKTLFPALRLGYLVLPEALIAPFVAARSLTDRYPPVEAQAALAEFIASGRYAAHLRRMRVLYAERRQALGDAVARHLTGAMTLADDSAGLETVGWLSPGFDDGALARRACAAGLAVEPVSQRYLLTRNRRPGLLLGFAATPPEEIAAAVRTLAAVIMESA